jgi:hypothetical protein
MSDIFISYKREEQPIAKSLADALESVSRDIFYLLTREKDYWIAHKCGRQ